MKKFMAFMMALVLSLACFGTYGFADIAMEDASHDHAGVVHAADPDMLFIVTSESSSSYKSGYLTIELVLGPSKITSKLDGCNIGITITGRANVLDGDETTVRGTLFGESGDVTGNSTGATIRFEDIDAARNTSIGTGLTIRIPVNDDFVNTPSNRAVQVKITASGISVDTYANTYIAYICNHPQTRTETVAATCTTKGQKKTICTTCEGVISTKELAIDSSNHVYDYSKHITGPFEYEAPTCSAVGAGLFECTECGKIEEAEIPKLDHKFGDRYLKGGVYYEKCSVCKKEQKAADQCSHDKDDYEEILVLVEPTCTTVGSARYQCPTCSQTEERELETTEHDWNTGTITKQATCTSTGTRRRTCLDCGAVKSETVAALEHDWSTWELTEEASCVDEGTETRVCANCDKKETRKVAGTGHEYGQWITTYPASCVATGTEQRTCALCEDTEVRVQELVDHTWGEWQTVTPATCVAQGTEKRTCGVCYKDDTRIVGINPENHSFGDWKTVSAKTCLVDGVKSHACTLCGVEVSEVDECVGHVLGDPIVEKKYSTKVCGVCGYKEVTKTVKKGIEKTLSTAASGSLLITGADAAKNYVFEISAPTMEKEAYYRENLTFSPVQITNLDLRIGEEKAPFTAYMTLSLNIAPSLDDYEVKLYRLVNGAVYPIYEFDRKDGEVIIPGNELIGADVVFVEQGPEETPNYILPVLVAVVTLVIAGVAVYFFLLKNKKEELF